MANKNLFKSLVGRLIPNPDAVNHEGAPAYNLSPEAALAQFAATGCLNTTFYTSENEQLDKVLELTNRIDPSFIAQTAVYSRGQGFMKDMPALLCAVLTVKDLDKLNKVFDRVIDNGKMLRNFVQIVRSGAVGRKSLGTGPKRLVRDWIQKRSDAAVFRASVGNDPSLADIIKMVHPKPTDESREALYGYLIGREVNREALPTLVRDFERFKNERGPVPDVPFQMLTALELGPDEWKAIARNAGFTMTRMNLNTFVRHGVFEDPEMVQLVAGRLADPDEVRKARVFPYQIMTSYLAGNEGVPQEIREALQDALETATENVPAIEGRVAVCLDVSGSMTWPVTGYRKGATSAVRCIDAAALMASAIVRKNPKAVVLPFEQQVVRVRINPRDSVMTNARKLAAVGGGGTNISAPLTRLNQAGAKVDLVIFISDNESWMDPRRGVGTETMHQWNILKKRNPDARLVCLDIQPYGTTQAPDREDILNIGGFSDQVFNIVAEFAAGRLGTEFWADQIRKIEI